jgi:hypothetical protein
MSIRPGVGGIQSPQNFSKFFLTPQEDEDE